MATDTFYGADAHDNPGPNIYLSISVIVILSSIALAGRLIARRLKRVSLGLSDYTLIAGWLIGWGLAAIVCAGRSQSTSLAAYG